MAKLFVLEDKDEFKLVDADGNVLATEKKSAALSTDAAGHEHGDHGHFVSTSAHEKTNKAIDSSRAISKDATQKLLQTSHRATKLVKEKRHGTASNMHNSAAKMHRQLADMAEKKGIKRAASAHREAADAHDEAAAHHEMADHESRKGQ